MKQWKTTLETHYCDLKCSLHSEITELSETQAKKKYFVCFSSLGICIENFDKVASGSLGTKPCFDVLSASEKLINYIELKSIFGLKELTPLGRKFYYGHLKADAVLAAFPKQNISYKYIVIYEKDIVEESQKQRESTQERIKNYDKDDIHAWKNNFVLIHIANIHIAPFSEGRIPIQKYLYTGKSLQLD